MLILMKNIRQNFLIFNLLLVRRVPAQNDDISVGQQVIDYIEATDPGLTDCATRSLVGPRSTQEPGVAFGTDCSSKLCFCKDSGRPVLYDSLFALNKNNNCSKDIRERQENFNAASELLGKFCGFTPPLWVRTGVVS